jgi:hypothetical protein
MKNLLIFIGPSGVFHPEHEDLTKMQIDNSLELGWKVEDILLVTNFPYEYRGVKSYVIRGDFDALDGNRSSKILAINQLFADGVIGDDLYWFHDHDAFQLEPMRDPNLGDCVAGFTDNGWLRDWNAGSFFFTKGAKDMFLKIYVRMIKAKTNEQDALTYLWKAGLTGYKMINITYNVGIYHLWQVLKMIEKPLLVAHFHPHKPKHLELFRDFLPPRLLVIFKQHGIE